MAGCGADTDANDLMTTLLAGENLIIPAIDFSSADFAFPYASNSVIFAPLVKMTNADLTTKVIGGSGTFDVIMSAAMAQLQGEYQGGRISGAEYTKAYVSTIEAAMQTAVSFLVQRDAAFWQAQTAQLEALKAKVAFATAKIQGATAYIEAVNSKAVYALTKLKLSTESMTYCTGQYQLNNILPAQLATSQYQLSYILPAQLAQETAQTGLVNSQKTASDYQTSNLLPQQLAVLKEQVETARATTLDTRTDGTAISGSVGSQKALYAQQILSYKRDAEVKASKLFTDAWITMKTIDEGLDPPTGFTNANLDQLLTTLIINNDLGTGEIPSVGS